MWRTASCYRNHIFEQSSLLDPIESSQSDTLWKSNGTKHYDLLQIGRNRDGNPYNVDGKNLLHYNFRSHAAILVFNFFIKQRVTVLCHPPYSLDLVSRLLFVSPLSGSYERPALSRWTGNSTMCGIDAIRAIPGEAFGDYFQQLYKLCQKRVGANSRLIWRARQ